MTYEQKKSELTEKDLELTEMMELANKDVRAAVINMFQMLKNVETTMNTVRREMDDIKMA